MNFDLQIAQGVFADTVQAHVERLVLTREIGVAGVMDLPFDLLRGVIEPGVVDHVTVSGVALSRAPSAIAPPETITILAPPFFLFGSEPRALSLAAAPVLVRVTLDLHCVRLSDLEAAGVDPVPDARVVAFQVRANFTIMPPVLVDGTVRLGARIASIEFGSGGLFPSPESLPEPARTALRSILDELNSPESLGRFDVVPPIAINVSGIATAMGTGTRLWNAGITLGRDTLTIRMQFDRASLMELPFPFFGAAWLSEWRTFFSTNPASRLAGMDWALFLPAEFFTRRVETAVRDGLAGRPNFVLNADNMPRSTWEVSGGAPTAGGLCSPGGRARCVTRFSASAKGACVPFGFDVDVNCMISLGLSLPRPNVIRGDLHLDFSPDEGDAAVCAITNSHLLASAGFVIGGVIGGGFIGAAVGAAVGGLLGGIGTLVASYTTGPGSLATGTLRPVEGSDRDYFVEVALPLPADPFFGALMPATLTPCVDGLAVNGALTPPRHRLQLLGRVRMEAGFRWVVESHPCPLPPSVAPSVVARAAINWTRSIRSSGIPIAFYGLTILDSIPAGYQDEIRFERNVWLDGVRIVMTIPSSAARRLRDQAAADGVDRPGFRLLLQTSCGARPDLRRRRRS